MAMLRWEPLREMENALRQFSPLYVPDNGTTRDGTAARIGYRSPTSANSENEYLIKIELPNVKKCEDCRGGRCHHHQWRT